MMLWMGTRSGGEGNKNCMMLWMGTTGGEGNKNDTSLIMSKDTWIGNKTVYHGWELGLGVEIYRTIRL